jgi:LysM repeat protein
MKSVARLSTLFLAALLFASCANDNSSLANDPVGTGPFDEHGRYREDWADDPSKWRRPGSRKKPEPVVDELPVIARDEQPPADATPLATRGGTGSSAPQPAVSTPRETKRPAQPAVTTPRPKPVVAQVKPKPKPKPVVKPKPKATRHIVKKGDTLSAIAKRYGSSVSAIQRANGLSGTLIHPGKSLVVPKR